MRRYDRNPLFFITVAVCFSYSLIFMSSIFLQKPIYLVQFIHFGLDQSDFLRASRDFITHQNPYLRDRFVTPPLSIFINLPLVSLDDYTAAVAFFVANLILSIGSIYITQRSCELTSKQRVALLLLSLISAPTLMLFERGNIDGVVAFVMSLMLLNIKRDLLSGLLLAIGILTKLYPLIIVFTLLVQGLYRIVIICATTILIAIFAWAPLFISFLTSFGSRVSFNRLSENLSSFAFLYVISQFVFSGETPQLAEIIIKLAYYGIIFLILAVGLMSDFIIVRQKTLKAHEMRAMISSYFVFIVNVPGLVYLYSGIMIILMLTYFSDSRIRMGRDSSVLLCFGCGLLLMPARTFNLTVGYDNISQIVNFLPPLGGAMLLWFFVSLKIDALSKTASS